MVKYRLVITNSYSPCEVDIPNGATNVTLLGGSGGVTIAYLPPVATPEDEEEWVNVPDDQLARVARRVALTPDRDVRRITG